MTSVPGQPPMGRFVNHKTLKEGWTYISTSDGNVIGLKISVTKVVKMQNPDGSPMINPDGTPAYYVMSSNILRVLTRQEWDEVKRDELPE
jgi:outer membrane protein assembly factor BamB